MTPLATAAIVIVAAGGLAVLARARIAAARRRTHATVEKVRAELGLPADRCRLIDVPLGESIVEALCPWKRPPRFGRPRRLLPLPRRVRRQA